MENNKDRSIVLIYSFLSLFLTAGSVKAYYDTIYTPCSTIVKVEIKGDMTQTEKDSSKEYYTDKYPNAIFLSEATTTYNCHSFAWNMSEGGPICWAPYPTAYRNDSSYVGQDTAHVNRIEKVLYSPLAPAASHSAIQTTVDSIFDSKWGPDPLFRHKWNDCPFYYGDPFEEEVDCYIYNRYKDGGGTHFGRPPIKGKTFNDSVNDGVSYSFDRRIASNSNLTIDSSTVDSGANVDFAAGGTVFLGPGFIAKSNSTVTVRSWASGGLLKRAVSCASDKGEFRQEKGNTAVHPVVPVKSDFQVMSIKSTGLYCKFSLPQPCNVLVSIFDIQGKLISRRDLGVKEAGNFSGMYAMLQNHSGMYIIKATLGGTVRVKKVVASGRL